MRRAFCILLTLGAAATHAADFSGNARAWGGVGLDTNPHRDFTTPPIVPPMDMFASVLGTVDGTVETDRGRLYASYELTGRKFLFEGREDALIQAVQLDGSVAVGKFLGIGVNGRARDRRSRFRDYTDLAGELYAEFSPDAHLNLKIRGGAHRFLYWNQFDFSFWGPTISATVAYRFNKRHSVYLEGDFESRSYNATACLRVDPPPEDPPVMRGEVVCQEDPVPPRRQDSVIAVGVGYTFRGPFHLTTQYAYVDSSSNGFAESYRRHRFAATLGLRLPLEFTLLLTGAVQIAEYPQGLRLKNDQPNERDLNLEGSENANTASVKIVHPLGKHVDLDLKYSVYFNKLERFTYLRMVASLGVGWKW